MAKAKSRSLPHHPLFAAQIARALDAPMRIVQDGDYPSAAVDLLLVRDHPHVVSVSLPTSHAWSLTNDADWSAALPEIRSALAAHPRIVTLADVVIALRSLAEDRVASFPGVPIPTEAWLRRGEESIGLNQLATGVRVLVWIGDELEELAITTPADLTTLETWLPSRVDRQREAQAAATAETARRAALPIPSVDAVVAHLRAGHRIATGGGRYFETYWWTDADGLQCEAFDEGDTRVHRASKSDLERAIGFHPDVFRKALGIDE